MMQAGALIATLLLLVTRAAAAPVGLEGAGDSRLRSEIERELKASGFAVVPLPSTAATGAAWGTALATAGVREGVIVAADNRKVAIVSAERAGQPGRLRMELAVDPKDDLSRRRVRLAVVEYLYAQTQPPWSHAANAPRDKPAKSARAGSPIDPIVPIVAPTPAAPPPSGPPPGDSSAKTETTANVDQKAALPVASAVPRTNPWAIAVSSMINFDSALGEPTSHVQFAGHVAVYERLGVFIRALWPVFGSQFDTVDRHVRAWTFGLGAGSQLALRAPAASIRPFVGLSLGSRLLLTDSDWLNHPDGRVRFTPSISFGAKAGALYRLRPHLHLLFELEIDRDIAAAHADDFEGKIGNGQSTHASLGVLFGD